MRYHLALSVFLLALVVACRDHGDVANSPMVAGQPPTLRQLATALSGVQSPPHCGDRGPHGEYPGPAGEQYCVWSAPNGSPARGEVSAHMAGSGQLLFLQWTRPTNDEADAKRIVDSLGKALSSHGLVARACPSGDVPAGHVDLTEWDAPTLLVQLSRITPAHGAPSLLVLATDVPKAVPDVMCPRDEPT